MGFLLKDEMSIKYTPEDHMKLSIHEKNLLRLMMCLAVFGLLFSFFLPLIFSENFPLHFH